MCLNIKHYEIPLITVQDPVQATENSTGKFIKEPSIIEAAKANNAVRLMWI